MPRRTGHPAHRQSGSSLRRESLKLFALVALFLSATLSLSAQSFEVASVKPAATPAMEPMFCIVPCSPGERLTAVGSRVDVRYMSLQRLILIAYRIKPYQLSGPDWMNSQRFDILAKMPEGVSKDKIPEMLQALLAERFKLSIHRDRKEQSVFGLVVGKNGSKLQPSTQQADVPLPESPGSRALYTPQGDARMSENGDLTVTGGAFGSMRGGRGPEGFKLEFLNLTMPALAELLTPHVDHPVVDMTGLKGAYEFSWTNRPPPGDDGGGRQNVREAVRSPDDTGPRPDPLGEALFTAMTKAGLKLEARKAPMETIVVDHLEKSPTAN